MELLACQKEAADAFVAKAGRMYLSAKVGHGKTLAAAECHRRSMEKYPSPHLYLTTKTALHEQAAKFRSYGCHVELVDKPADKRMELWKSPQNVVYMATLEQIGCEDGEWSAMRRIPWGMVTVDEADRLTGSASKRNKRLLWLNARHRLLQSGTPLRNGLKDAFFPVMWLSLSPPWRNWTNFKTKELLFGNPLVKHQITGIRDEERLAGLVRPLMHRMFNPDAPTELVAHIVPVTLSMDEKAKYDTMVDEMIIEAENGELGISNRAVLNLRCRQFVALPEAVGIDLPSSKEAALLRLLSGLSGDTIVFTSFASIAEILSTRHGWPKIIGAMSMSQREEVIASRPKILIATSAAERGLDMPWLTNVVSMDAGFTPATIRQRAGRATRYGREGVAQLFLLQAEGTVDVTSEARIIERKLNEARKVWNLRSSEKSANT